MTKKSNIQLKNDFLPITYAVITHFKGSKHTSIMLEEIAVQCKLHKVANHRWRGAKDKRASSFTSTEDIRQNKNGAARGNSQMKPV